MTYEIGLKAMAIYLMVEGRMHPAEIARFLTISRETLYRWRNEYLSRTDGYDSEIRRYRRQHLQYPHPCKRSGKVIDLFPQQ